MITLFGGSFTFSLCSHFNYPLEEPNKALLSSLHLKEGIQFDLTERQQLVYNICEIEESELPREPRKVR